jgi:hypothetical protein
MSIGGRLASAGPCRHQRVNETDILASYHLAVSFDKTKQTKQLQMIRGVAAVLVFTVLASFTSAHAQLSAVTRYGDLMVNDATLNLTWADVESPPQLFWLRSPFAAGRTAQTWVASLNAANGGRGYGGYHDWRLATGDGGVPFSPANSANELGSLFYTELGNTPYQKIRNLKPFTALRNDWAYWSGSRFAASPQLYAWGFNAANGRQFRDLFAPYAAIAVRSGQVSGAQ